MALADKGVAVSIINDAVGFSGYRPIGKRCMGGGAVSFLWPENQRKSDASKQGCDQHGPWRDGGDSQRFIVQNAQEAQLETKCRKNSDRTDFSEEQPVKRLWQAKSIRRF